MSAAASPTASVIARGVEQLGEHVAPRLVRAEPVRARRRLQVLRGVRRERARGAFGSCGASYVPEDRHEHEDERAGSSPTWPRRVRVSAMSLARPAAGAPPCSPRMRRATSRGVVARRAHSRAHPRVEARVQEVGGEVADDHHRRGHEVDALQHREVLVLDRLDRREPDPGPREQRLDRDRAAEHEAEVERDLRHDRQPRGRHDVAPAHAQRAQADRARGHDVVGVHHVGHGGARDEDVLPDLAERQRERRQDQVRCRRPPSTRTPSSGRPASP